MSVEGVTSALDELHALLRPGVERCRAERLPCVIAITGSVAVGKSTTAVLLRDELVGSDEALRVEVVSTDGFLYPNRVLDERGLSMRKGFPETYDRAAIVAFIADLKRGVRETRVPVYSHEEYDVLDDYEVVGVADVVIVEGLHLVALSEAIDDAVYVDAEETVIERWYVERFLALCRSGHAFYRQFTDWPDDETIAFARQVWAGINAVNLHEHILPTRPYADAVLEKDADHSMRRVWRPRDTMST